MPHQRNTTPQRFRPHSSAQHQQRVVEGGVRDQTWPGTLMVLGIFVVVISFWWVGSKTFITYSALGRWFALFAFAGNLLSYKAGLRLGMERLEWFLFNLLAVGPLLFSLALWVNLEVHGPEKQYIVHMNGVALTYVVSGWKRASSHPTRRSTARISGQRTIHCEKPRSVRTCWVPRMVCSAMK